MKRKTFLPTALALLLAHPASAACPHAPIDAPLTRPASGDVTKKFGLLRHPLLAVTKMHTGIDFAGPRGATIHAAAAGEVLHAGWRGPMGKYVEIDHGNGSRTAYAHLAEVGVAVGACVAEGDPIGTRGSTGLSTGPNLHFEVRKDGRVVDPEPLLRAKSP